jgi:hypothetical protein
MFSNQKQKNLTNFLSLVIFIGLLLNCAAKKPFWGDPQTGLILQYRLPQNDMLKYKSTSRMDQNLEVMGNSVENKVFTSHLVSFQSNGMENNLQQLTVTVDSMNIDMETPQGNFSPKLSQLFGKSFNMNLSILGKESNLEEASELTYNLGPQGERSIASEFEAFFPNLPERKVAMGDSWISRDTINVKSDVSDITLNFESLNKLVSLENLEGFDCAKIIAEVKGKMTGSGNQQGTDMTFDGDIKATETWYFAYKKGIFIKTTSEGVTDTKINITAQGMIIPMTMKNTFEKILLD